jgi:TonB-linked SusC/RagA family outer membrane protein
MVMPTTLRNALTVLLAFFLVGAGAVQAQDRTVAGTVTDAETGDSLPGVNVTVPLMQVGTTTDAEGRYSLDVPEGADSLAFSFVGYQQTIVAIQGRSTINVSLRPDVAQLDEVVVTSFGIEEEQRAVGYSVEEVSGAELEETSESNLVGALSGKLAGVQIRNTSGAAGGGQDIVIRGLTSLSPSGNNQPLFIVDGIPVSNQTNTGNALPSEGTNAFKGSSGQFSFTNRAAEIPPENIENISVLKGPAATALYGLRASNGAVVITTKKGRSGQTRVNFNSSVGMSEVNKTPEIVDEYQKGVYGALPFTVFSFEFFQYGPPATESGAPIQNHFGELFRRSLNTNNSITVSGGDESTTYLTSFSHTYREGVVPNTDWQRLNVKLRGTQEIGSALELSGSLSFSNSGGTRPTGGDKSIMSSLTYWTPSNDVNDFEFPDGSQRNYSGLRSNPNSGFIDNPRYYAENSTLEDDVDRGVGFLGFTYDLTSWLSFDYKVGADVYTDSRSRFAPPVLDVGSQVNGFITKESIQYQEINSNAFLRADRSLTDKLDLSLTLGHQVTDIAQDRTLTRGENFNVSDFQSLANTTQKFSGETASNRHLVGVFGKGQLAYDDTYYLTLTGRNDWSSTLPADNRSFFYPSVNLGYVFTEDLGLSDSDVFPFGKLRVSWAEVGKDAPPFSVGQFYGQATGFPFGGTGGFTKEAVAGDLNLKPEETTSFEVGTDLRFFNNRLRFDLTYYTQTSENQIVDFPVSLASGLSQFTSNAGRIESSGWEVAINGTILDRGDFSWDASLNWSTNTSEVKTLPEGLDQITFGEAGYSGISARVEQGDELGTLYGFNYKRDENGNLLIRESGARKGFPIVTRDSVQAVGNAFPDWEGGITNTISYKGLELSALVEVKWGGDAYDVGSINSIRNGTIQYTTPRNEQVVFDGVLENSGQENDIGVDLDQQFWRSATEHWLAAENSVQDASWIRLRNVRLRYQLPGGLLTEVPISRASLSVTGRNLFLDTPFRGFDPEGQVFSAGSNIYGITGLNIPPTRSLTFQVNLQY